MRPAAKMSLETVSSEPCSWMWTIDKGPGCGKGAVYKTSAISSTDLNPDVLAASSVRARESWRYIPAPVPTLKGIEGCADDNAVIVWGTILTPTTDSVRKSTSTRPIAHVSQRTTIDALEVEGGTNDSERQNMPGSAGYQPPRIPSH